MDPIIINLLIGIFSGIIVVVIWEAIGLGKEVKRKFSSLFINNQRRRIFEFTGDLEIFISKPNPDTARNSDTYVLDQLKPFLPSHTIIAAKDEPIDIGNLKTNLLIIGSPRFNNAAEEVQKYFDTGFEFVFDSYEADPKLKILKILNKYGDTFASSKDLKIKGSILSADYGVFFKYVLPNKKKIIWIAGIHGHGTLGITKYLLASPLDFIFNKTDNKADKLNVNKCMLFRINYKENLPATDFDLIEAVEIIEKDFGCKSRNIKHTPKKLILDFGNVLMFWDRERTYRALSNIIKRDYAYIRDKLEEGTLRTKFESGELKSDQFYKEVLTLFGIKDKVLPYPLFCEIYGDIFWLNKNIFEALKILKNKIDFAILSNTNEIHFNVVRNNYKDIIEFFGNKIILSYQVNLMKPDPVIFRMALELFGKDTSPADCIYVDDLLEYVETANKLGMKGVVFYRYTYFIYYLRKLGIYVP